MPDPIGYLDNAEPDWREDYPLQIDDAAAVQLLTSLVKALQSGGGRQDWTPADILVGTSRPVGMRQKLRRGTFIGEGEGETGTGPDRHSRVVMGLRQEMTISFADKCRYRAVRAAFDVMMTNSSPP